MSFPRPAFPTARQALAGCDGAISNRSEGYHNMIGTAWAKPAGRAQASYMANRTTRHLTEGTCR